MNAKRHLHVAIRSFRGFGTRLRLPDRRPIATQLTSSRFHLALILASTGLLLTGALVLASAKGIPIGNLTRDPVAIFEGPAYYGLLSQLGIFLWAITATICLMNGRLAVRQRRLRLGIFLLVSAGLTLFLGIDDAFLLHERVLPRLGIPETAVFLFYAAFVGCYLVGFLPEIVRTDYLILGIALSLFAASMASDLLIDSATHGHLIEDGIKMAGIICWMSYFVRVGGLRTRNSARPWAAAHVNGVRVRPLGTSRPGRTTNEERKVSERRRREGVR